jgi:hypothetical protein
MAQTGLYTHRDQADRASGGRPGVVTPATPPCPLGIRVGGRRRNASRVGRSRPSREIRHLKSRLRDIAEGTLSSAIDPRRATVAVQAYNASIRALEQERKTVEQEEVMERLERLEARKGMAS